MTMTDRLEGLDMQQSLKQIDELKYFLATAPVNWQPGQAIRRYYLNDDLGYISCVFWENIFYITGTDIVKVCMYRMMLFGRVVIQKKKFEEGIFSDLRSLKLGEHAVLEQPKSRFLDFLFKNMCVKTQKKQKVFYWFSVPHDKLISDALERDLKRETTNQMQSMTTRPIKEPALSFRYDKSINSSLFDQVRQYFKQRSLMSFESARLNQQMDRNPKMITTNLPFFRDSTGAPFSAPALIENNRNETLNENINQAESSSAMSYSTGNTPVVLYSNGNTPAAINSHYNLSSLNDSKSTSAEEPAQPPMQVIPPMVDPQTGYFHGVPFYITNMIGDYMDKPGENYSSSSAYGRTTSNMSISHTNLQDSSAMPQLDSHDPSRTCSCRLPGVIGINENTSRSSSTSSSNSKSSSGSHCINTDSSGPHTAGPPSPSAQPPVPTLSEDGSVASENSPSNSCNTSRSDNDYTSTPDDDEFNRTLLASAQLHHSTGSSGSNYHPYDNTHDTSIAFTNTSTGTNNNNTDTALHTIKSTLTTERDFDESSNTSSTNDSTTVDNDVASFKTTSMQMDLVTDFLGMDDEFYSTFMEPFDASRYFLSPVDRLKSGFYISPQSMQPDYKEKKELPKSILRQRRKKYMKKSIR